MGGRLVLINRMLDDLPTNMMSLLPLPVQVSRKLDKLCRDYYDTATSKKKAFNLVKWSTITLDKKALGMRDLKSHNFTLSL